MKQAGENTAEILHKIEAIEKEILDLKLSVLTKLTSSGKKLVKLKGILKGKTVSDKEIASAKKSLYSKTGI